MEIFKRVMTIIRPSKEVIFLGGREDPDQTRRQMFADYEKLRTDCEAFKGAVFCVSRDELTLEKTEIWKNQEEYLLFIEQNRSFISNLVKEYEEYCGKNNIKITRTHQVTPLESLNTEQKKACSDKAFVRQQL